MGKGRISLNGNNIYNNRITVDYQKQTVTFDPVKGGMTKKGIRKGLIIGTTLANMIIGMGIILIPAAIISATVYRNTQLEDYITKIALITYLTTTATATLIMTIKSRNEKWMKEKYPETNATILNIISMGIREKRAKIKPEQLYRNMMIIPNFGNISLKYKLYGEFTKLKRISINNTKGNTNWYCIFEFRKKPKTGHMTVKYM